MAHFDDVVAEAEAGGLPTTTVSVVTNPADGAALAALERDLQAAVAYDEQHNEPDTAPAVLRRIEELEAAARSTTFTLRALSAKAWSDLEAAHPPVEGSGYRYNPDTFEPAAVAACIIDPPGATTESVDRLRASVASGQWAALWGAVAALNMQAGQSPLSARLGPLFDRLRGTAPK